MEEWVAELCRLKIDPPIIPFLAWVKNAEPGRDVLAIRVPIGPDKPYARVHNGRKTYFIRVGSTSQEASRDELERMFQASGHLHYGVKPVPGAGFDGLDYRRLRDYLVNVLGGQEPADDDAEGLGDVASEYRSDDGVGKVYWSPRLMECFSLEEPEKIPAAIRHSRRLLSGN